MRKVIRPALVVIVLASIALAAALGANAIRTRGREPSTRIETRDVGPAGQPSPVYVRPVNPARPTPALSPPPGSRVLTVGDAIAFASGFIAGQSSTGLRAANVQSVEYVQTTVGQAANLIGTYVPSLESLIPPNTVAWLFVSRGYYARHDRYSEPPLEQGTLWVLAIRGGTADADIAKTALNLTLLGTPVVIPRGQVPEIDAVRADDPEIQP